MKADFKTFFYYNWWKFALALIFIAGIIFSISQCNSKIATDFGILYISEESTADGEVFKKAVADSGVVRDADGKDGTNVLLREIYIPESAEVMHQQRIPEQIRVELISGECTLYLLDKETLYENEAMDIFYDLKPLAEKFAIPEEKLYTSQNGRVCAISLSGNRFLNSNGAPCDLLYLAIKNHAEDDQSIQIQNATAFAEYILKNQ